MMLFDNTFEFTVNRLLPLAVVVILIFEFLRRSRCKNGKSNSKNVDQDVPLPPAGPSFFDMDMQGSPGVDLRGEPITITHNTRLFSSWVKNYGKVFRLPSPIPGLLPDLAMISDATATKELLLNHNNLYRGDYSYGRDSAFCGKIYDSFGHSLASLADISEWKWRKNALMREFHKSRLMLDHERQFFERVVRCGEMICEELEAAAQKGQPVHIHTLTVKTTASIIFFFLFGRDLPFDVFDFYGGAVYLLAHLSHLAMCPFHDVMKKIPFSDCYKAEQKKLAAWRSMDSVFEKEVQLMVREHKGEIPVAADRKPGSAIASLFKTEPKFMELRLDLLIQEVRTIVIAGFENTSNSLAFAIGVLSERPDIGNRIAAEARSVMKKEGHSDLATFVPKNVSYLEEATTSRNLFMETVRLYPLIPGMTGRVYRDLTFTTSKGNKYKLPKGTVVMNLPFDVQRDPENLGTVGDRNPNVVDPDRWNAPVADQPFLIGFSMGAHVCPGKSLSVMEGHVILLMVAARFTFHDPEGGQEVSGEAARETNIPFYDVSVARPKDGLLRIVKRRDR